MRDIRYLGLPSLARRGNATVQCPLHFAPSNAAPASAGSLSAEGVGR